MAVTALDTLRTAKRLQGLGFEAGQAEGLADLLRERYEAGVNDWATQRDLADAKAELKRDIADVRQEIASLRAEFKADLLALEQRMTIRLGVMLVGAVAVMTAVQRLLGP